MKRKNIPRISQCMIVKNEEKNIEKALSWAKGIVAEQIVVDTGSTDRTVEIARQMGAKIYHFEWIDDFAAAKNYAISKARYEWIAFLDADEYMMPEDAKKLLNYVRELHPTSCESIMTAWIHLKDDGSIMSFGAQVRVFRNMPTLRYKRRIHEYLIKSDGRLFQMADVTEDISIYHTGYQTEASDKKTGEKRNFKLIQAELADNPEDFELHGYLGNEYEAMSQWLDARESYKKAVSLMPETRKGNYDTITSGIYYRLLSLMAVLWDTTEEELMEIYHKAIDWWPEDGDFDCIMGEYYARKGHYKAAEEHLRQAFKLLETYGNSLRSSHISATITDIYELLAVCCYNNGKLDECAKLTTAILKENPYRMKSLVLMLSAFQKDIELTENGESGAVQVIRFLGSSFYNLEGLKDRLFILRSAKEAGYKEMEKVMEAMFSPEELAIIQQD